LEDTVVVHSEFPPESGSKRILKIGLHLPKFWSKVRNMCQKVHIVWHAPKFHQITLTIFLYFRPQTCVYI